MLKIRGSLCIAVLVLWFPVHSWSAQPPQSGCFVAHLKSLALRTHQPQLRATMAEELLKEFAAACTNAQLSAIQSNSPNWLGSSLTMEFASILEGAIEAKITGNPEMMGRLYESLGKEGKSSNVTLTTPVARAPVVQATVYNGALAGSVNYGSINDDTSAKKAIGSPTRARENEKEKKSPNAKSKTTDTKTTETNAAAIVNNSPNATIGQQVQSH